MSHVPPDDLIRYRIDRSLTADAGDIDAHLAACELCADELAAIDAEERALRHDQTWEIADAKASPARPDRLQRAVELKRRIERENAHARRFLAPLFKPSLRLAAARIATKPRFLHAGTVRVLCEAAQQAHEKRPISALEMATEAYNVAAVLPADASTSRRLCMAFALRECANALRYLGRFRDALIALDRAEPLFDQDPAFDPFEVGVVNLIRATVLMDKGDLEQALLFAGEARRVCREYRDHARELIAAMVEARCSMQMGHPSEAAEIYESVVAIARRADNASMLARGLLNAGVAYRVMGDFAKAEQRTLEAIPLFDELQQTTELARANLQLATIAVERGDLVAGIRLLEASQSELADQGLTNDAAVATLRWAEASLALGRHEDVVTRCRRLVVLFTSEAMHKRARIALAYLQEALAKSSATPTLVAEVREYLESLPSHPDRDFVPSTRTDS